MRLDGFGLLVEDMAKMIRFYRDECFGFMQELPDKYPQMSIFDL